MAPRCHKMAPRPPQEPQGGPKTTPRGAKLAPRRPQDSPKTAPRRLRVASIPALFQCFFLFLLLWAILLPTYPQLASKMPSCWPSCLQDGSKLLPRPQLGPNLAQLIIPNCVQYVAVRPPPGLPLCGLNPAAAFRLPVVSDSANELLHIIHKCL